MTRPEALAMLLALTACEALSHDVGVGAMPEEVPDCGDGQAVYVDRLRAVCVWGDPAPRPCPSDEPRGDAFDGHWVCRGTDTTRGEAARAALLYTTPAGTLPTTTSVDPNAWPFCDAVRVIGDGEIVDAATAVDGRVLGFGWRAGSAPRIELLAAPDGTLARFEVLDRFCVPLLRTPATIGPAAHDLPLDPGFYVVLALASRGADVRVRVTSGPDVPADAAPWPAVTRVENTAGTVGTCAARAAAGAFLPLDGRDCEPHLGVSSVYDHADVYPDPYFGSEPRVRGEFRLAVCGPGDLTVFGHTRERMIAIGTTPGLAALRIGETLDGSVTRTCRVQDCERTVALASAWVGVPYFDIYSPEYRDESLRIGWYAGADTAGETTLLAAAFHRMPAHLVADSPSCPGGFRGIR